MLLIERDTCVNCGGCKRACSAEAVETGSKPEQEAWLALNERMAPLRPVIISTGEALAGHHIGLANTES